MPSNRTLPERFWSHVAISDDDSACWEWTAHRTHDGYGRVNVNGVIRNAHRVAYELVIGPIPDGFEVDHLCSNRACCRPSHLEAVTTNENHRRTWQRLRAEGKITGGALTNRQKTHCVHGHPFDERNTYYTTAGRRACRMCALLYQRRLRAERRAA